MRALVTGSTEFLGLPLTTSPQIRGHEVVVARRGRRNGRPLAGAETTAAGDVATEDPILAKIGA